MRALHIIHRRFCAFTQSKNVIVPTPLVDFLMDLKRELKEDQQNLKQELKDDQYKFFLQQERLLFQFEDRLRASQARLEDRLRASQARLEKRCFQKQNYNDFIMTLMTSVFVGGGLGVSVAVVGCSLLTK